MKNGEDVYLSSLYSFIHSVAGVVNVTSLTMGTDGVSYNTDNITILPAEVARINIDDIEVVVLNE